MSRSSGATAGAVVRFNHCCGIPRPTRAPPACDEPGAWARDSMATQGIVRETSPVISFGQVHRSWPGMQRAASFVWSRGQAPRKVRRKRERVLWPAYGALGAAQLDRSSHATCVSQSGRASEHVLQTGGRKTIPCELGGGITKLAGLKLAATQKFWPCSAAGAVEHHERRWPSPDFSDVLTENDALCTGTTKPFSCCSKKARYTGAALTTPLTVQVDKGTRKKDGTKFP